MTHKNSDPSFNPSAALSEEAKAGLAELRGGFHLVPAGDGGPAILNSEFAAAHSDDTTMTLQRSTDSTLAALGDMGRTLLAGEVLDPSDTARVESLLKKEPVFVGLDPDVLSDDLRIADVAFGASNTGVVLQLEYTSAPRYGLGGKINVFPGLQKDDRTFRVLQKESVSEDEARSTGEAFSLLTFPSEVALGEDGKLQAIVEYVQGAERPTSITQPELDDWLARVGQAGVDVGSDIGPDDESLDNLLRFNGRLFWCDGDLIFASPVSPEVAQTVVENQRAVLQGFVDRT